jgi:hypothetical protein
MNHNSERQSHHIDKQVPLATADLLASVIAMDPPFSVVLIDWESKMPALGWLWRPAARRS